MKKKILVIGELPPPTGGIQMVIQQILHSDLKKNYELVSLNTTRPNNFNSNYFLKLCYFLINSIDLIYICITKKPKIAHIHVSYKNGFWRPAIYQKICKFFGVKTIFHMHGSSFKEFYSELNQKKKEKVKSILSKTDRIIVLSEAWKNYYSNLADKKKIVIIPNSVETINKSKYKRIYPKDEFIVLFVGSICERKGVYDLLEAISKIKNKKIKFVFVGPFEDKNKFLSEVDRLKIKEKCKIVGEIIGADRFKYFASADCFILPSYAEGLPVALLEAMSFGLPIISTKVGAIPEVIKKENGILIDAGNIEELKNDIEKISSDKALAKKMSKNNKKLVEKEYSLKIFTKNLEKVYGEL